MNLKITKNYNGKNKMPLKPVLDVFYFKSNYVSLLFFFLNKNIKMLFCASLMFFFMLLKIIEKIKKLQNETIYFYFYFYFCFQGNKII
jgi:hypothetical protein